MSRPRILGGHHILVVEDRITYIVTKTAYQTGKGVFIRDDRGKRLYVEELEEPLTFNNYTCRYRYDARRHVG